MPKSAATRLQEDLRDLSLEITDHLRDAARTTGDDAVAALHRSSDALSRAARRLGADLRVQTRDSTRQAVELTRAHPLAAVGALALATAVIGYLLTRGRSDL